MEKMTAYHGGYLPVVRPKIILGRTTKGFGPGFYCTLIREQGEQFRAGMNSG